MDGHSFNRILFLLFAVHLLFPVIFAAKFDYCDRRGNYPVKVDGLEVSPYPVKSGKPATFTVSASTDALYFSTIKKDGHGTTRLPYQDVEDDTAIGISFNNYNLFLHTEANLSGGKFEVEVSLFGVHIHSESHDLCEETSCPVKPGKFSLAHSQSLPPFTPPGMYSVRIILKDIEKQQLTCISFKLKIVFGDGESAISEEESLVAES